MDFYWLFRVTEEFFMFQNPLQIILDSDRLVCGVGEGGRWGGEGGEERREVVEFKGRYTYSN